MRPTSALLIPAFILLAATAAGAQERPKGKAAVPRIDCAEATAPPEIAHCAEIRLKKADSELASALEKVRVQAAKRARAAPLDKVSWISSIDAAHKAWLAYREADCKGLVPYEWDGGTGTNLAVTECMAQMTESRAFELLERYAERR